MMERMGAGAAEETGFRKPDKAAESEQDACWHRVAVVPGQDTRDEKRHAKAQKKPRTAGWEPRAEQDDDPSTSLGCNAIARAMPTRAFCPPDI